MIEMTFDEWITETYGPDHGLSGSEISIAREAWGAAHEQCALLCDQYETQAWELWDLNADMLDQGEALMAGCLAKYIRAAIGQTDPAPEPRKPQPAP